MAKHEYAKQILAAGFKVVVVEQVERVVETNQRKSEANGSGETFAMFQFCFVAFPKVPKLLVFAHNW